MGLPVPKPKPTLLLTRPLAQSEQFAQMLRGRGYDGAIVISPLLQIEGTGVQPNLDDVEGVIFTSRNAIDFVAAAKKPAWCVGEKTAEAAGAAGWDAISADGDADALVAAILAANLSGKLAHVRGEHSRGDVAHRLIQAGTETVECVVYRQSPLDLTAEAYAALSGETPVIVPLFSPRSAGLFANKGKFNAPLYVVVMSEAVAQSLDKVGEERVIVTRRPTAASMLESILSLIDAA